MIDLSVDIGGIMLKSPVILAAGPLTTTIESLEKAAKTGVGAIDTKVAVEDRPPRTKCYHRTFWDPELHSLHWMINGWEGEYLYIDDMVHLIKSAKQKLNVPIFGNFTGLSEDPDEWIRVGSTLEKAGADALVTYYCEVITPQWAPKTIELAEKVHKPLCESVDIPVIFKISPRDSIVNPAQVAKVMEKVGVSALQASDGLGGLPSLNIENPPYHPFPAIDVQSDIPFISGPILRPLVYRAIYEMSRAVKIPMIATGGIWEAKHSIEAILYGASAVAASSGPVLKGWRMFDEIIKGIKEYMERHGFSKIEDFRGLAQQYFGESTEIRYPECVAVVDEILCTGCGKCLIPAHCNAIKIDDGIAVVRGDNCNGCCVCSYLCLEKAISISRI